MNLKNRMEVALVRFTETVQAHGPNWYSISAFSSRNWLASWYKGSLGNLAARKLMKLSPPVSEVIKITFKEFLLFFIDKSPYMTTSVDWPNTPTQTLLISWCLPGDESKIELGIDRYFGKIERNNFEKFAKIYIVPNGKAKTTLASKKIENLAIIYSKWDWSKPFKALKWLLEQLIKGKSPCFLSQNLSARILNSMDTAVLVESAICKLKILPRYLLFPYEAQPEQRSIINMVRTKFPDIYVMGYVHSSPMPVPTHYFYDRIAPDLVFLHGRFYLRLFHNLLGWNSSHTKFETVGTMRFEKKDISYFLNKIFLPFDHYDTENIILRIQYFLKSLEKKYERPIIQVHPARLPKQIELMRAIDILLDSNAELFDKSSAKMTVFIGASTSILEAVEHRIEVIQICEEPELEFFDPSVWPSLNGRAVSEGVYTYKVNPENAGDFIIYEQKPILSDKYFESLREIAAQKDSIL